MILGDLNIYVDKLYVPETSNMKIFDCMPGTFISDHRFIICELSIVKGEVTQKTITEEATGN